MSITRRQFLQGLGLALGAATVASLAGQPKIPGWENLREEGEDDASYRIFEAQHPTRWTRVNAETGLVDKARLVIEVDDGDLFREDSPVLVARTREILRVVAVKGNTLTVARGTCGSEATNLFDQDWLLRL